MASAGGENGAPTPNPVGFNPVPGPLPVDKSSIFKGHPQPPVQERLEAAKNFLADEDPYRCLGFDLKIAQIEEYIKYIQDEQIPHDESLLRDVNIMAEVHRDWVERGKQGLPDTICRRGPPFLPVSNRLISAESAVDIQEEKEAMGAAIQMRDDHPPFSEPYTEDQRDFLKVMREDAMLRPEEIDEDNNLLFVESKAYRWALREPSMIPLWLHPTKGLPKSGILPTDPKPWYRAALERQATSGSASNRRPPIQRLPDYLRTRQRLINVILQAGTDRTSEGQRRLEDLLSLHEPLYIRELYDKYLLAKSQLEIGQHEANYTTIDNLNVLKGNMEVSYAEFQKEFRIWVRSFKNDGVQLMVLKPGVAKKISSGVFYLPPENAIPSFKYVLLEYAQAYVRQIRSKGFDSLKAREKKVLIETLHDHLDAQAVALWDKNTAPGAATMQDENATYNQWADTLFSEFFRFFAQKYHDLRLLYPGEVAGEREGRFYITWNFPKEEEPYNDDNDSTDVVPGVDLPTIQDEINDLLKRKRDLGSSFPKTEGQRLIELLTLFAHRPLRTKIYKSDLAKEKLKAQFSFESDRAAADQLNRERQVMWDTWFEGFHFRQITLKRQRFNEGGPGILYWHQDFPDGETSMKVRKRTAARINLLLRQGAANGNDELYGRLAVELEPVQYSRLRDLQKKYRELEKVKNTTGAGKLQIQTSAKAIKIEYSRDFRAWTNTFRNFRVEIRGCDKNLDCKWRGDPSTLFYRGPIQAEYPHYLYLLSVDQNTILSDKEINKARSLLDTGISAGLEGVDLGMQVRDYLPLMLGNTLNWDSSCHAKVFIPWFEDWVNRLRAYNAGSNGANASLPKQTSPGPNPFETMEIEINAELKNPHLDKLRIELLDRHIYKFWQEPHRKFIEQRKAAMASQGLSLEDIESLDWSIFGQCREDFEDFKNECRLYGFKISHAAAEGLIDDAVSGKPNQKTIETIPNPSPVTSAGASKSDSDDKSGEPLVEDAGIVGPGLQISPLVLLPPKLLKKKYKINDVMERLNKRNFRFHPTSPQDIMSENARKEQHKDVALFWILLRDFYPEEHREHFAWLADNYMSLIIKDQSQHEEAFRNRVQPWYDGMLEMGSVDIIEPNASPPLGIVSNPIYYNPVNSRYMPSYDTSVVSEKLTPEMLEQERLAEEEPDVEMMDTTTSLEIQFIQNRINSLLRPGLTYPDILDLYSALSSVMPLELRNLHDRFLNYDLLAKTQELSDDEAIQYGDISSWYADLMRAWIVTFPWGGITIGQIEDAGVSSRAGVLYLNGLPPTPPPTTPRTIPIHLYNKMQKIDGLLKQQTLTEDEESELYVSLRTFYGPYDQSYRQHIRDELDTNQNLQGESSTEISTIDPSEKLQPERLTYTEARAAAGYRTWYILVRNEIAKLTGTLPIVGLTETSPGVWEYLFQNIPFDPKYFAEATKQRTDWMRDAERLFLNLARKVRLHEKLTSEEETEIKLRMEPLSTENMTNMVNDLAWGKVKLHHIRLGVEADFTDEEKEEFREKSLNYLWQYFGTWNPELRQEILPTARVPDAVSILLNRGSSSLEVPEWPVQPSSEPVLSQPSESERMELQIEVNNLLTRWKNGVITKQEEQELRYLLEGRAMPIRLQAYRRRVRFLEYRLKSEKGLDPSSSLRLMELKHAYSESVTEWLHSRAVNGIILDDSWFTSEAIDEIYTRAMAFKRLQSAVNGVDFRPYPTLGGQYLDKEVERVHQVYAILRDYLSTTLPNGEVQPSRFLFMEHLVLPLKNLLDDLKSALCEFKKSYDPTTQGNVLRSSAQYRFLRVDFIKLYLDWYRSLTPAQIKTFGGSPLSVSPAAAAAAKAASQNTINFTSKAERRGVQRAAIEHALTLLATNQEQHRPIDRFRRVDLPPKYQPTPEEVPLWVPLEAWKRPVEMDTFEFSKKMLAFRDWKDSDYDRARSRTVNERPGAVQAPVNFNGPFTLHTPEDLQEIARKRQLHLTQVYSRLGEAERSAPRPLIQQILFRIQEGMVLASAQDHRLADEEILSSFDIEIIEELTQQSWDEERIPYADLDLGLSETQFAILEEFERDVDEHRHLLPLWKPAEKPQSASITDSDDEALYRQIEHDPDQISTQSMPAGEFKQVINTKRLLEELANLHLWTDAETTRYLEIMHQANRIHFDSNARSLSQVPLSGHPENRYVISRDSAEYSPGVHLLPSGHLEVQYDVDGTMGPPIVQPNKYHYLQRVAYRIGRDIAKLLHVVAGEGVDQKKYLRAQYLAFGKAAQHMNAMPPDIWPDFTNSRQLEPTEVSLKSFAIDLNLIAPDLAEDAGINPSTMTELEAASLLQMEILEEASNNWESRFPENEHVWEFARPRVETRDRTVRGRVVQVRQRQQQFFRMNRYPLPCQCDDTQIAIQQSGPIVQEKPKTEQEAEQTDAELHEVVHDQRPIELHRGKDKPPFFPFGETPYAASYLDWRMQNDLKDVPEFQSKPQKKGFFGFGALKTKKPTVAPYTLPALTPGWLPESISEEQQRHNMVELAKTLPDFPDPNVLENYHTQAEIVRIKHHRAYEQAQQERYNAILAMEQKLNKKIADTTTEERDQTARDLGFDTYDPRKPTARPAGPAKPKKTAKVTLANVLSDGPGHPRLGRPEALGGRGLSKFPQVDSPAGPARNTRSRSPKKRAADNQPTGQGSPKKKKTESHVAFVEEDDEDDLL